MLRRNHVRMQNRRLAMGLAALCALLVVPQLVLVVIPAGWRLTNVPLHTLLETFGCAIALSTSCIEYIRLRTCENTARIWLVGGLVAMGLLDGVHAAIVPGELFSWLKMAALCAGGLFSALIWLPGTKAAAKSLRVVPYAAIGTATAAVALLLLTLGDSKVHDAGGAMPPAAMAASVLGGLGFLAAGVSLLTERRRDDQSIALEIYCITAAAAALGQPLTLEWDAAWWCWHALRLAGIAALLLRGLHTYMRSQQELVEMNELLEHRIAERAASAEQRSRALEISQRALQFAVHAANTANEAKSRFLAHMSHEIRTPMNAILGMADLLWETPLNAEQRNYVQVFRRAGQNLLALINSILDLSKIESGQFELDRTEFDLTEIMERTLEIIRPRAAQKGIQLIADISGEMSRTRMGDPLRLQQVLMNLLGNAVKFTEQGRVTLTVRQGAGPEQIAFAIADTGIGIPPDRLQAIFEDFGQADASTTRRYGGTGLGLGIARRLVQFMGGQLAVESELGRGSTFRFEIACEIVARTVQPRQHVAQDFAHHRVLVVDDNPTNRMILRETLRFWGLESAEYGSPGEGVAELRRAQAAGESYSLILLDHHLPPTDGFAASILLREVSPEIPIIMLSSDENPGDAALRRQHGILSFSAKPVRRAELLRQVCSALAHESLDAPPVAALASTKPQSRGGGHVFHVLVAEDSEDNRILLDAYLKESEYSLQFVEDGSRAVGAYPDRQFDLVLMDLQMPVMDGLEATRRIREFERANGKEPVPILALTANALPSDIADSRAAGCDAHLAKPVSKARLLGIMRQYALKRPSQDVDDPIEARVPPGLEQIAPGYLAKRRGEIPLLERLCAGGEWNQLRVLGHNMKGSGAGYGFPEISAIGAAIEQAAKQSNSDAMTAQLRELAGYLSRVVIREGEAVPTS